MTDSDAARGPNWLALAGAALVHLCLCAVFFLGTMLGDCRPAQPGGDQACFAAKDLALTLIPWLALGFLVAAPLVEWKRRSAGAWLLLAAPFVILGLAFALPKVGLG